MNRNRSFLILFSILLIIFGFVWVTSLREMSTAQQAVFSEPDEVLGVIPNFKFTDQNGENFSNQDIQEPYWIADFVFTRCAGPCPVMFEQMLGLQQRLKGVRFISFTVDPEYDTPEVLKQYALKNGADLDSWTFLTGEKEEIFKLAKQHFYLGVGEVAPEKQEAENQHVWHSTKFVLVNQKGEILGYFDSYADDEIKELERKVKSLLRK